MEALYTVQVFNPEYIAFFEDVARMVTIQLTIQFLYYINSGVSFFNADFVLLVIYIVLGVCVYWLVFKKLIVFK